MITCHPKRGTKGIDATGVLGRFTGVAVHDVWAPYDADAEVGYQRRCAHALHELAAVVDTPPADASYTDALDKQISLYRFAIQIGITQTAARSCKVMRKHNTLARKFLDRQDDYLRLTNDWRIPADNNGSERDIRITK